MLTDVIIHLNTAILYFFAFSVTVYTLLLISAFPEIITFFKRSQQTNISALINNKHLPPITIIIASWKAQKTVAETIWSALKSTYPNVYIIVVNDGSNEDNSFDHLVETFELQEVNVLVEEKIQTSNILRSFVSKTHPNLMLVEKEHRGTGDSLNVGINLCFTPYVMPVDADSFMAPEAITEIMHYIVSHKRVIAVSGGVYLLNGCTYKDGVMINSSLPQKFIAAMQSNEYLRSHIFNRTAWNRFGGTMCYSGTATAFFRQAILDLGGFDVDNFAQDAEIVIKMHEHYISKNIPYHIGFTPSVAVWTVVPETIKSYAIQQDHWRRGLLRSTLRYWYLFFNPRYKLVGLFNYPIYMLLEMMAPYVEFCAYFSVALAYYDGILNAQAALMYALLAWGFSSYITVANVFINLITFNRYQKTKDVFKSLFLAFADMLGFRQYVTAVKVFSTFRYGFNRLIGKPQ